MSNIRLQEMMENKDTHAPSSQTNNSGHCVPPWHSGSQARHQDSSKTAGRIPVASSPLSPPHKTTFSFSLDMKRWRRWSGGWRRNPFNPPPTPSQKYAFVPFAVSGPHTTQLTGRAHMKQIHRQFEPFHYFFILKLRASHIKSIQYNTKEPTTANIALKKNNNIGLMFSSSSQHCRLAPPPAVHQCSPGGTCERGHCSNCAACVCCSWEGPPTAKSPPTSCPPPVPRCCNLLQLFHNCLVSYH